MVIIPFVRRIWLEVKKIAYSQCIVVLSYFDMMIFSY